MQNALKRRSGKGWGIFEKIGEEEFIVDFTRIEIGHFPTFRVSEKHCCCSMNEEKCSVIPLEKQLKMKLILKNFIKKPALRVPVETMLLL
ncbi:hypothetical protein [Salinicoccus bachuensis]|uniref:Uncharacterized protein n=1 Tax=Salinicoccus bachuensis TaxID=3136731 RepID=A0ABZ3IDJ4_9STAP